MKMKLIGLPLAAIEGPNHFSYPSLRAQGVIYAMCLNCCYRVCSEVWVLDDKALLMTKREMGFKLNRTQNALNMHGNEMDWTLTPTGEF